MVTLPAARAFVSTPKITSSSFQHAAIPAHRTSLAVRMAEVKRSSERVDNPFKEADEKVQEQAARIEPWLKDVDEKFLGRVIRFSNHLPVLGSLLYFGLISMKSMTGGVPRASNAVVTAITSYVGPTSARSFSDKFPTLVTPARFVFFIWPIISAVQLVTVGISALQQPQKESLIENESFTLEVPSLERTKDNALLSQNNLSALLLANIAATWWIVASSNAVGATPPLSSFLILPLVPLFSGYPIRTLSRTKSADEANKVEKKNLIFQIYSSFTTLAALLALTVELQHGGRVPFIGGRPEVAAAVFLVSAFAAISLPGQSRVRKWVYAGTVGGILWKRVAAGLATGVGGLAKSLLSVSFLGTIAITALAVKNLIEEYKED